MRIRPGSLLMTALKINSPALAKKAIKLGADPRTHNSHCLRWSAYANYVEMFEILLPYSDLKISDNATFTIAAASEHWDIVKLMLPHYSKGELQILLEKDYRTPTLEKLIRAEMEKQS
jgi:hypothetical protein